MKNGPYELIIAPEAYPGKRYRDRYAYEHIVAWWLKTGEVPGKGYEIHHVNGDHRDNRIDNLQLLTSEEHKKLHCRQNNRHIDRACDYCGKVYSISGTNFRRKLKVNKLGKIFCSQQCAGKYQWSKKSQNDAV